MTSKLTLPTRVPAVPWNVLMTRIREKAELGKYGLAKRLGFSVQSGQLTKYEDGRQCPSLERFVSAVEACGGVVIIRRGCEEYQVIPEAQVLGGVEC